MVGNGIPGVVNANEEQQQRGGANDKEQLARVHMSRGCRERECRVRHQRQEDMKQLVLEARWVCGLRPHTPSYDYRVRCSTKAYDAPKSCGRRDRWPGSAKKRRQQQRGAEMNDRRRRKRGGGYRRLSTMSVVTTNCKPIRAPAAEPTIT
jgi:hypothetical protein